MAKYDLTHRLAQFMDRHLVFPLLEFLSDRELWEEREVAEAKLELLRKTNMVDFMLEVEASLGEMSPEAEAAAKAKRSSVVAQLKSMQTETLPIVEILEKDEVTTQIKGGLDRDGAKLLSFLQTNYGFRPEMLDQLYAYAKFQYDCGNYSGASEYLYYYRLLVPQSHVKYLHALWGKLGSEILVQQWDTAKDDLAKVKAYIDNNPFDTELELLTQRAWLIHWALFIFFNHPKGRDELIELILNPTNPAYLNTLQILCPHLLRYLAVAVVSAKKRKGALKELMKVVEQERENYRDPVTEFLEALYIRHDFEGAQKKLRECETLLANDFFLVACLEDFFEAARHLIFETFCRIHEVITISMLAEKLNLEEAEAERWIVNLIRNAALDARIDSAQGHVIMARKAPSIHETVMEATKRLSFRSQSMAFQLEKLQDKNTFLNQNSLY